MTLDTGSVLPTSSTPSSLSLTALARAGFLKLDQARDALLQLGNETALPMEGLAGLFSVAADPDAALERVSRLLRRTSEVRTLLAEAVRDAVEGTVVSIRGRVASVSAVSSPVDCAGLALLRVLGASSGLADFLERHPEALSVLREPLREPLGAQELREELLNAVEAEPDPNGNPRAGIGGDDGWVRLRVSYRRRLLQLAAFDLGQTEPARVLPAVAACLADLAAAALEASLAVARATTRQAEQAQLSVIAMGKTGARELNYVSDVDVIFVGGGELDVATRLAQATMRGCDGMAIEPPLWQVDANLRPEGKKGALVRSLESHLAYYQRWASPWEFQALLKARPVAGDRELGDRYISELQPQIWSVSQRPGFVEQVQRMRERVTDNIPADEVDWQLKLGPGGLRDVEFTVQLLQLVHGHLDLSVRDRDTLGALSSLAAAGYIGRSEASSFADDYRMLRVWEHRAQLRALSRTHLMPREEPVQRALARAAGVATAAELMEAWQGVKQQVRGLHARLFYRPLLSAVARLNDEDFQLTSQQAVARLFAIGFRDPRGALAHIEALTSGLSRRAAIQRTLLPVMLGWLADGADPDYGLLAFRRLSDELGEAYWFLRLLRDSSGAAQRLTRLLSGSRYVGELLLAQTEAVAWLDDDNELHPRSLAVLQEEFAAVLARHDNADTVAGVCRAARRREALRLAIGVVVGVLTVEELGKGLSDLADTMLGAFLAAARQALDTPDALEFSIIAMGRYGGRELGLSSDVDIMYVYRADEKLLSREEATRAALALAAELKRLSDDPRLSFELDLGLRPEGKNGPVARSLEAYAAYYQRWSLTWEAQALLRARPVAGNEGLGAEFVTLADRTRYPVNFGETETREVRRIKARVEKERLPQGANPARHLKLGRGSLSDVEWFVQLQQLRHGRHEESLRTTSTLDALAACAKLELVSQEDAALLRAAWILASQVRSALTLWSNRTGDVLPVDRVQLDGIARLLNYPPDSSSRLEEDYLQTTRRARTVFERGFYG